MSIATEPTSRDALDEKLDEALAESFPASDAPSLTQPRQIDAPPRAEAASRPSRESRHSYPVLLLLAGIGWLLSRLARGGPGS
jgi:hypothetical protein